MSTRPRPRNDRPVMSYVPGPVIDQIDRLAIEAGISRAAWVRGVVLAALRSHAEAER